jgi:hypothetical protein
MFKFDVYVSSLSMVLGAWKKAGHIHLEQLSGRCATTECELFAPSDHYVECKIDFVVKSTMAASNILLSIFYVLTESPAFRICGLQVP